MLENFSPQAISLIEAAETIAKNNHKLLVGTEDLLLAMFNVEDTICHFLLGEEQITKEELTEEINKLSVSTIKVNNSKFTPKFNQIVKSASDIIKLFNSDHVYDEHLFYSLLNDKDNNGIKVLINLGLDPSLMIQDILDIFNVEKKTHTPEFLTNLSLIKEIHPYIARSNYLEKLDIILNKKQKNNPMLIGSAGVGKTALVEAYAKRHPNLTIYRLDLGTIMAGTKYRGELEDKIITTMDFIKKENAILFIDEIHNIVGAGSNEGTLDIANIIKPYLARSDIYCIGSTTLDEYYQYIDKDKALSRRFHNIYIDEPTTKETKVILQKIKNAYEVYHNTTFSNECLDYIINRTDKFLPLKTFPDKAIDVLDELGSRINLLNKKVNKLNLIDEIIKDLNGISINKKYYKINLHYEEIKPLIKEYLKNNKPSEPIMVIGKKDLDINKLIGDLELISSFKKENYLEIDLENYHDESSLNNLIGSNKGYIGYDTGGILSEHILKHPFSLINFMNFDKTFETIKNFIIKLTKTNYFLDNKGRKIIINNCIFIIDSEQKSNKQVGICSKVKKNLNDLSYNLTI